METEVVNRLHEGRPNLGDMITNKQIDLIINTPVDRTSMIDDSFIRMQSIQKKIPYMTTIAAARATVEGIRSAQHVKVSPAPSRNIIPERGWLQPFKGMPRMRLLHAGHLIIRPGRRRDVKFNQRLFPAPFQPHRLRRITLPLFPHRSAWHYPGWAHRRG
ncbi:MAG: hypothetical protein ACLT8E_02465 [Akkermansia sp.]